MKYIIFITLSFFALTKFLNHNIKLILTDKITLPTWINNKTYAASMLQNAVHPEILSLGLALATLQFYLQTLRVNKMTRDAATVIIANAIFTSALSVWLKTPTIGLQSTTIATTVFLILIPQQLNTLWLTRNAILCATASLMLKHPNLVQCFSGITTGFILHFIIRREIHLSKLPVIQTNEHQLLLTAQTKQFSVEDFFRTYKK